MIFTKVWKLKTKRETVSSALLYKFEIAMDKETAPLGPAGPTWPTVPRLLVRLAMNRGRIHGPASSLGVDRVDTQGSACHYFDQSCCLAGSPLAETLEQAISLLHLNAKVK